MDMRPVTVIGGGLAGCEAAYQLLRRGVPVKLYEMRPEKTTPAHKGGGLAELVCSNSLRAASVENAVGLLKEEMRCIWLDNDTIVMKDIGPLTDIDLEGNYVAMVEEPVRSLYPFKYHNAGVMVMDLEALRGDWIWQKWIRIVNGKEYTAPDQDAVNLICQGEILTVGPEWNHAPGIVGESPDPAIRHYCGCHRPIGNDWFEYYRKADWRVMT